MSRQLVSIAFALQFLACCGPEAAKSNVDREEPEFVQGDNPADWSTEHLSIRGT
jgi:hypothetical protein